jgi:hypothetical protein
MVFDGQESGHRLEILILRGFHLELGYTIISEASGEDNGGFAAMPSVMTMTALALCRLDVTSTATWTSSSTSVAVVSYVGYIGANFNGISATPEALAVDGLTPIPPRLTLLQWK